MKYDELCKSKIILNKIFLFLRVIMNTKCILLHEQSCIYQHLKKKPFARFQKIQKYTVCSVIQFLLTMTKKNLYFSRLP